MMSLGSSFSSSTVLLSVLPVTLRGMSFLSLRLLSRCCVHEVENESDIYAFDDDEDADIDTAPPKTPTLLRTTIILPRKPILSSPMQMRLNYGRFLGITILKLPMSTHNDFISKSDENIDNM